jgi:outer membrane protein OmpA-like peptidoglycan-associated protein
MSRMSAKRYLTALVSVVAIGAAFSFGATQARAGDVTEDQIVNALTPAKKPLTRGLSVGGEEAKPVDPAQAKFVSSLKGRTRGLNLSEREELATIAKDKPNIDLEITFDYNSADISSKSLAAVQTLGRALTNPDLKGSTFVVAGHTDAAGSDGYNQELSERRADSIKHYLVEKFNIAAENLVTVGYGKTKPKDPNAPMDPLNRRVQVVNMIAKTASN